MIKTLSFTLDLSQNKNPQLHLTYNFCLHISILNGHHVSSAFMITKSAQSSLASISKFFLASKETILHKGNSSNAHPPHAHIPSSYIATFFPHRHLFQPG